MSGVALANFLDFVEGTTSTYVNGPMGLVMEAVKNTYWFGRLIQGQRAKKKMISGGANLRHSLIFQDSGQFETYLPGANHVWSNPQRLKKIQVEWRYTMGHMSWVEQEIINNEIIAYGDDEARFCEFVNIRNEKETIAWGSIWNGLENLLWQVPFPEDMEAVDGTEPYSIPAAINEDTNGLFNPRTSAAFTTFQGLTNTDASLGNRYKPQQVTYTTSTVNDPGNIISKMDDLAELLTFEQPPTMTQYWEDPRFNKQMIVTTRRGRAIYKQLLRQSQDHFVAGPQDPAYPDPQYFGIPISRASTLEGLALYNLGGASLADEFGATNKGPRFYFFNAEYLYPVFHARRYFYKYDVTKHHNVPDTWVAPIAVWYNLINPSRQRQGILSPSGSVYTA
jgi:hypothetical protein